MGDVVEPAPLPGSLPGTISMTWTDPCDVEVRDASPTKIHKVRLCRAEKALSLV